MPQPRLAPAPPGGHAGLCPPGDKPQGALEVSDKRLAHDDGVESRQFHLRRGGASRGHEPRA